MTSNNTFIFVGPTISVEQAKQYLNAVYLPPVKYGDVYRITELYQPQIIGIIDGYFNQVPAVWHKEILWAIDQGATVFGASSMGALRGAELNQFGMQGCGKIFRAYQSGTLLPFIDESFEDDDEVAVIHGPAELGYKQTSEAMVNIRFTLANAYQQNVINIEELRLITEIAKSLFYPERQYSKILELAEQQNFNDKKLADLKSWLEDNKVDQKRLDAIEMFNEVKKYSNNKSLSTVSSNSDFQHSSQWQTAINEIDQSHYIENPVLNEIRLTGERYFQLLDQALSATLIYPNDQDDINSVALSMLYSSPDQLNQTLADHWRLKQTQSATEQLSPAQCNQLLLYHLEQTGELAEFSTRADDKKIKSNQLEHKPDIADLTELDLLQLCDWYFTQCLHTELPSQLEEYASQLGFTDMDDFYDMILQEYTYLQNNK